MTTPGVDPAQFRQMLGRFATGVTILTTRDASGALCGMTASSIASVSLTPPLVLVSVDRRTVMHRALSDATHFVINVLAADQEALARRFAEREENRFDGVGYRESRRGIPLLDGALAHIECVKQEAVSGGDHTVFFGLVTDGDVINARPLLYFRGGYASL